MTPAQKWARKRNFSKFRLRGITTTLSNLIKAEGVLTGNEEVCINKALNQLDCLNTLWNQETKTSKRMYVKEEN